MYSVCYCGVCETVYIPLGTGTGGQAGHGVGQYAPGSH